MTSLPGRPIAEGLFVGAGDATRLLGGRRLSDGKLVFPLPSGAERAHYQAVEFAAEGRLWSYTIQRFRPKAPYGADDDERSFRPYAVGYVELPGEIIVESRLEVEDFASLRIGMLMRVGTQVFRRDGDVEILTYVFRPLT